jgi:hypothetical protein
VSRLHALLVAFVWGWLTATRLGAQAPGYRNPDLPLERRANDLVSRLTLEEKVSQMQDVAPAIERLGIPAYNWWNEALHGVARSGLATSFPQAIGLAATWDHAAQVFGEVPVDLGRDGADRLVQQDFDVGVSEVCAAPWSEWRTQHRKPGCPGRPDKLAPPH